MQYLGEDELTQVMGVGQLGEIREGPDGGTYQWVHRVDGLGNPIGFWRALRRVGNRFRKFAQRVVPAATAFVPGLAPVAAAAQQAGILGYDGLGALYQAPDGALYQVQGLAEDENFQGLADDDELSGLGQDELTQMMGIGQASEVRRGPDGELYKWIEGFDGLGNPVGFWSVLKRGIRRFAQRAMPFVQTAASFIPGAGPAVAAATPVLRRAGILGYDGLGALFQSPDGTFYQVRGLGADEELDGLADDDELQGYVLDPGMHGLSEDEELQGFADDEELHGLAEDEELHGLAEDEELSGLAEGEELSGLADDEDLQGFEQGYVREDGVNGFDAYVPEQREGTRWFTPPGRAPEIWKPIW